jgi:peptidoglycan/xylan/chitin deacetylase (PgdA/CDA1 family)
MRLTKRITVLLLALSYHALRVLGGRSRRSRPVILTYHAIKPGDLQGFRRQMEHLGARLNGVFADACGDDDHGAVAVTFDDAFQSVVDNALPVLKRHGIPATIFVPTGYLGETPGWIVNKGVPTSEQVASAATLKGLDPALVRLGSHTVTHPRLTRLDGDTLRAELSASKQTLEEMTGRPISMLSFPYGLFNADVIEAARRAGYEQLFANVPVDGRSRALVGRINVTPGDWPIEFRLKTRGAYDWMALAVPAKRTMMMLFRRSHA